MKKQKTAAFPNTLFCIYQAISDDMIFWAMFDVLFLTMNKGFSMVQVSLLFTISYWVSIALQGPSYYLSRKLKAGGSIVLGAFMFFTAALMITFGKSFAVVTIGQCISLVAGAFQKMSAAILKDATARSNNKKGYVNIMSAANVLYSVITLTAACSHNALYRLNPNLPMYICIFFCAASCIMSIVISRYATKENNTSNSLIPGKRIYAMDRTTIVCLIVSVLGTMIFFISEDNLKILLKDNLAGEYSNEQVVFIFSIVVIATRVIKLIGNLISFISERKGKEDLGAFSLIILVTSAIGVMALASFFVKGWFAIVLIGMAIFAKASVFDSFRVHTQNFMLNRLNNNDMMFVLYIRNISTGLFNALASSLATIIIASWGLFGVVIFICILIILLVGIVVSFRRSLIRRSGGHRFLKWKKEDMDKADDLTIALAVLMEQYGIVNSKAFTPNALKSRVSDISKVSNEYKKIDVLGQYPYSAEKLNELYKQGSPCAILAKADDMAQAEWMPVIFLDDDGGIVWNYTSAEKFISHMESVEKIYSFKLKN